MTRKMAFGLVLGLLCASFAGADDVIKLANGKPDEKGKITRLEIDGLSYEVQGKQFNLKREEVAGFTLGDVPAKQRDAESKANSRDYANAIKAYGEALADPHLRAEIHKQFIYVGLARAQRLSGDPAGAIDTVLKLLKECPKGWALLDGVREGMEAARAKKDDAKAKEIVNVMRTLADPVKGYAELELGKWQYANADYSGASASFGKISGGSQSYSNEAKAWSIRALRAQKKSAEMEPLCKGLTAQKDAPPQVLQAAWSGLGDALMEKAGGDKTALHEAVAAYAQAISMGPPAKDANGDDYVDALLNIARCYVKTAQALGQDEKAAKCKEHAIGYYSELIGRYRTADWAKDAVTQAEKEMGALGSGGGEPAK